MSCSLNSLKGLYKGLYMRLLQGFLRGILGVETRAHMTTCKASSGAYENAAAGMCCKGRAVSLCVVLLITSRFRCKS